MGYQYKIATTLSRYAAGFLGHRFAKPGFLNPARFLQLKAQISDQFQAIRLVMALFLESRSKSVIEKPDVGVQSGVTANQQD